MRRMFLFLLCAAASLVLNAQQWTIDYGTPSSYMVLSDGIVDTDQSVIFVGVSGPDYMDTYPCFMRVGQDGNHQSYILEGEPFKLLRILSIVQMKGGNFFVVGKKEGAGGIEVMVLDPDFNILTFKHYDKPEAALSMVGGQLLLDDDGTVVLVGSYRPNADSWGNHYFLRFNSNADTIASRFHARETQYMISTYEELYQLLPNPQTEGYIVLGCGINGCESEMFFDRDFNYEGGVKLTTEGKWLVHPYSDHGLSDSQLILFGVTREFGYTYDIGTVKVGLDGTMEPFNEFLTMPVRDSVLKTPRRNMAYVNDTTIYGAYYQWDRDWVGGPSITRLCLFNTDDELLGLIKIASDETDHYDPSGILPTPDGGCIIAVNEFHDIADIYRKGKVIKLSREDFNPIPWSVKEVPQEALKALAFPNPAKEELHIDISGLPENKEHRIQITDALGHVCMSRIIRGSGNLLTVGVSSFSPGVYTYLIYNDENKVITGKFIKH